MILFDSFFSQDWVKITTTFFYVILIIGLPFIYVKMAKKLPCQLREDFAETCWELYGVQLLLLIAPAGYLVLYFFNLDSSFIDNDPLPWVCFLGGMSASFDYLRTRRQLKIAKQKNADINRLHAINGILKLSNLVVFLAFIPLVYGVVMIAITNSTCVESLPAIMWLVSFMITGLAVIYSVWSKVFLIVSQKYASNSNLASVS